mmetsp:Transcript_26174/g.39626  ORF Transcript_26174/g.39626 Transcript_26174/m.39626 type:complete len:1029 (+) Transcript_26174:96-3182(+)
MVSHKMCWIFRKRSLILALALSSFPSIITPTAAMVAQHRVKRGQRQVPYKPISKKTIVPKFWVPRDKDKSNKNDADASGSRHSVWFDENGSSWHLHVDAKGVSKATQKRSKRRLSDSSFKLFSSSNLQENELQGESIQGTITHESGNQTWNVSTHVEVNNSTSSTQISSSSVIVESDGNETSVNPPHQPMRIRAVLSEEGLIGRYLFRNETARSFLLTNVLRPAILAWSAALRVNPVAGNLTVDSAQFPDGVSCGPGLGSGQPSVVVPEEHTTIGIPDTDFVFYLSFSVEKKEISRFQEKSDIQTNSSSSMQNLSNVTIGFNSSHIIGNAAIYNSILGDNQSLVNSTGDYNGINGNGTHDHNQSIPEESDTYCSGSSIAAATYCSTDQYDRPTAGILHLCIGPQFFDLEEARIKRNIMTVIHELGHMLGFNPHAMAHFRAPDGSPLTPRDENGDVVDQEIECTGPNSTRTFANVTLPSEEIIQFRSVRGGVRVAEVVTPLVKQVVRNHFDCQNLSGAELESGLLVPGAETTTSSCIGDHWERRLFRTDILNAVVDESPFSLKISPLSLSLFADSGWYQVDTGRAAYSTGWGRGAGCPFVNEACLTNDGLVSSSNEPFFCNEVSGDTNGNGIQGCSPDITRKAVCSMAQYDAEIPTEYQYFDAILGPNVGGGDPLMDYCPVYRGFSNGLCKDLSSAALLKINDESEEFGVPNSRCVSGRKLGEKTALCVPIACVVADKSLRIRVEGVWKKCDYANQEFKLTSDGSYTMLCPDPVRTCPTFYCPGDCLGNDGFCNYTSGQCMCRSTDGNSTNTNECIETEIEHPTEYFDPLLPAKDSGDHKFPSEDAPLSDYYVPNEKALSKKKRRKTNVILTIIFIAVGGVIFGVVAAYVTGVLDGKYTSFPTFLAQHIGYCRRSSSFDTNDAEEGVEQSQEGFEPSPSDLPFRANKDKFVASMLVDMRVHGPQQAEGQSLPETSAETDSNANLSRSEVDMDELRSIDCSSDVSSLAPTENFNNEEIPAPQMIRRRFKF